MENLTDEHLRLLVIGLAKIAFVGGLAGALVVNFIFGGIYAVAEYFARRSLAAARIRAARARATAPAVAVMPAPGAPDPSDPPGHYCTENYSTHEWVGGVCVTCGGRADWGRAS